MDSLVQPENDSGRACPDRRFTRRRENWVSQFHFLGGMLLWSVHRPVPVVEGDEQRLCRSRPERFTRADTKVQTILR